MSHHPTPTTSARSLGPSLSPLLVLACWAWIGPPAPAGEGPTPGLVLHLANGSFVPGAIRDADAPGTIRWQSPLFETPFEFAVDAVNAVRTPAPGPPTPPRGTFRFDLAGGDVAFGDLVDLDETEAVVDLPRFGRLRVRRPHLQRIVRRGEGSDLVYSGPNGLLGWTPLPVGLPRAWRDDSGKPATGQQGASIIGDLPLPARSAFEFELSWKNKPDFVFALGVEEGAEGSGRAFRFEAWDDELVVIRETEQQADVAPLGALKPGPGRVHLRAYLDQERGKITVASVDGRTLAELQVAEPRPRPFPRVRLENRHGDVKLERLEVATWDGEPPRTPGGADAPGEAALVLDDGSSRTGRVVGYDDASRSFLIREGADHSRIPLARVARATFSATAAPPRRGRSASPSTTAAGSPAP